MKTFSTFITEEKKPSGPEHIHDLAFTGGNEAVGKAGKIMDAVHKKLLGKHSAINITAEKDHPWHPDPVMTPDPTKYTVNDQRRYLQHMENAKRVYSSMKPDTMDIVNTHGKHLKNHLTKLSRLPEPPKTDGFVDYLTDLHKKETDKTDKGVSETKKRHSMSNVIQHVIDHRQHYDKALELHHHLERAKDVLSSVIAKNYKDKGLNVHSTGAIATGHAGTARFTRKK